MPDLQIIVCKQVYSADDEMEVTTHDEQIKAAKEKEDREKYECDVKIDDSDDWNF